MDILVLARAGRGSAAVEVSCSLLDISAANNCCYKQAFYVQVGTRKDGGEIYSRDHRLECCSSIRLSGNLMQVTASCAACETGPHAFPYLCSASVPLSDE